MIQILADWLSLAAALAILAALAWFVWQSALIADRKSKAQQQSPKPKGGTLSFINTKAAPEPRTWRERHPQNRYTWSCRNCGTVYFQPQECDWCPGQQALPDTKKEPTRKAG